MTNDNPKSNCCGAEIRLSDVFINGVVPKMWCQKCNGSCAPKPLPSKPSCEQAVEPSVESIARSIRKNFAVGQRLDSFALACLEDQILNALRKERNRK